MVKWISGLNIKKEIDIKNYKISGAVLGIVLGLGSPFGGLFLRMIFSKQLSRAWIYGELASNFFFYLYMLLTVPLLFAIFGFFFGYLMD